MRTCCCAVRQKQGQAGGVIASMEWEVPAGSFAKIRQLCLSCSQHLCSTGRRAVLVMHGHGHDMSNGQAVRTTTPLHNDIFLSYILKNTKDVLMSLNVNFKRLFFFSVSGIIG